MSEPLPNSQAVAVPQPTITETQTGTPVSTDSAAAFAAAYPYAYSFPYFATSYNAQQSTPPGAATASANVLPPGQASATTAAQNEAVWQQYYASQQYANGYGATNNNNNYYNNYYQQQQPQSQQLFSWPPAYSASYPQAQNWNGAYGATPYRATLPAHGTQAANSNTITSATPTPSPKNPVQDVGFAKKKAAPKAKQMGKQPPPPRDNTRRDAQPPPPATPPPPAEAAQSSNSWPPELRTFVEKVFSRCLTDREKEATENSLKRIITAAMENNTLWSIDWERDYGHLLKNKTAPASSQTGKRQPERTDPDRPPEKRKKSSMGSETFVRDEGDRKLQQRTNRFGGGVRSYTSRYSPPPAASFDENDWDAHAVKGTSTALEKQFLRLTSAVDPTTVRPEPVLKKSFAFLTKKWKENQDYLYICEQFKSLRQDLTVQRIRDKFTVEVYETHARIALENGDVGEFNQCQTVLHALYKEGVQGNPMEFIAYKILYLIFSDAKPEMGRLLGELKPAERNNAFISHALTVRAALATNDYHTFFKCYKVTPNMGSYLLDKIVNRIRLEAYTVIIKAYRPNVSVEWLGKELGFDDQKEYLTWLAARNPHFVETQPKTKPSIRSEIDAKLSYANLLQTGS